VSSLTGWLEHNQFFSGGLTLMVIGGAVALLRRLPGMLWGFVVRRLSISVEIPDRDPAFRWVQAWVAEQRYARRARNLSLTTTWESPDPDPDVDTDPDYCFASGRLSEARFVLSPAPGTHVMTYRGHLMFLYRARRDLESGGMQAFQETLTLQILGGNRATVDGLLKEAHRAALPKAPGVNVFSASRHGCWVSSSWLPRRPLGSIVLADDLLEVILADIREFLRAGPWYAARGVPHRRGYLLHGPPGNGKTTLVAAAAGELGLSVAVLGLSGKLLSDESLRELIDALPAGSVLLMEDIDCAFGPKREANESTGVTLSGLLNAIDGVSSRQGRLLFMTTNHPERLDPALVRPGRVDRSIRIGNTTPDQGRRLFTWFYTGGAHNPEIERLAREFAARVPPGRVCMAAIQEHLLRYRSDPRAAVLETAFDAPDPPEEPVEVAGAWASGDGPEGDPSGR
jgi:chaperone BCS1